MPDPITVYATLQDLSEAGISDRALGDLEADIKQRALVNASSLVDDYIRARYDLPLTVVSQSIRRATLAIAVWDLFTVHVGLSNADPALEIFRTRYTDAMKFLSDIRDKKVNPEVTDSGTTSGGVTSPATGSGSSGGGSGRATSNASRGLSNRGTGRGRGLFEGGSD
jgi:phage gp36-like protein